MELAGAKPIWRSDGSCYFEWTVQNEHGGTLKFKIEAAAAEQAVEVLELAVDEYRRVKADAA